MRERKRKRAAYDELQNGSSESASFRVAATCSLWGLNKIGPRSRINRLWDSSLSSIPLTKHLSAPSRRPLQIEEPFAAQLAPIDNTTTLMRRSSSRHRHWIGWPSWAVSMFLSNHLAICLCLCRLASGNRQAASRKQQAVCCGCECGSGCRCLLSRHALQNYQAPLCNCASAGVCWSHVDT